MGVKRRRKNSWVPKAILLIFVMSAALLAWQYFTKTGLFYQPGVVYYDESLAEDELTALHNIFTEEVELKDDVTITARATTDVSELNENDLIYSVDVPVTDFYDARTDTTEFDKFDIQFYVSTFIRFFYNIYADSIDHRT